MYIANCPFNKIKILSEATKGLEKSFWMMFSIICLNSREKVPLSGPNFKQICWLLKKWVTQFLWNLFLCSLIYRVLFICKNVFFYFCAPLFYSSLKISMQQWASSDLLDGEAKLMLYRRIRVWSLRHCQDNRTNVVACLKIIEIAT